MKEVKLRYVLKDEENDVAATLVFNLIEIENNGIDWIYEQFELKYGCDGNCTNESVSHCECSPFFDNYVVVARDLFTGEKDIDKNEIYVGDFISVPSGYHGDYLKPEYIGKVVFECGSFMIHNEKLNIWDEIDRADIKIVGNIYRRIC